MPAVTFFNGSVLMAGDLYLPAKADDGALRSALVCVHPGNGVKEQTAGLYAAALAKQGFVTLAFDASHQGASQGLPRHLEDPSRRVEDIRCAVDYLSTLPFVDKARIGVLGVCAGGGYAVNAAMSDHRIAAVGVVSVINIGAALRRHHRSRAALAEALKAVGEQRAAEAAGAEPMLVNWIADSPEAFKQAGGGGLDAAEAVDYYRTSRGAHPGSTNLLRFTSMGPLLGFDAFHLVEELLVQPLQIIVGSKVGEFGSYEFGRELYDRAAGDKDLMIIQGAGHYDLYDRPGPVGEAVAKLATFYRRTLGV